MTRFRFLPGLRRVALRPNLVRLGTDPERSPVIQLPDNRFAALLDRLDTWLDTTGYRLAARSLGLATTEADAMLKLLRDNGLMLESSLRSRKAVIRQRTETEVETDPAAAAPRPRPATDTRARQQVFVNGTGALAHRIAETLRRARLGRVWCADEGRRGKATLTVLLDSAHPQTLAARVHARRRLPYLSVVVLDGSVHIGPLVLPGRTPCLNCVRLHHRDVLPSWPSAETTASLEAPVVELASGFVTSVLLRHLDGEPCPAESGTLRVSPSLSVGHQQWSVHPDCDCSPPVEPQSSSKPIAKVDSRSCLE